MTVLEQLRADFEALGPGAWEIGAEGTNGRVSHVGPFYGYDYDALEMFEDAPAAVWVVSAHNRMPLLLAVAEAAAAWRVSYGTLIGEHATGSVYTDMDNYSAALDALEAALSPLMEATE